MERELDDQLKELFESKLPKANLADSIMSKVAEEPYTEKAGWSWFDLNSILLIGSIIVLGTLTLYLSYDVTYPFKFLETIRDSEFLQFLDSPIYAWGLLITASWVVLDRFLGSRLKTNSA